MAENSHPQVAEIRHKQPRHHWQPLLLSANSASYNDCFFGTKIAI